MKTHDTHTVNTHAHTQTHWYTHTHTALLCVPMKYIHM